MRKFRLLLSGAAAGLVNGLLGAGGGMVLVPLLIQLCRLTPRQAFATSVAIIFPLSLCSVLFYIFSSHPILSAACPYLIGGAVGGLLGGRLFQRIDMALLRRGFGLLILYGGIRAALLL